MEAEVSSFLLRHNFNAKIDVDACVQSILYDMDLGLFKKGRKEKSGEDMIRTWMLPPEKAPKGQKIIVIDAGGTNFRSCLVSFDENGNASISDFKKTCMPGVERELSKVEFFNQFADNIDYLKNKADKIGFCFSYPMEITKDGDGITLGFSKEVKAPEVVGVPVGKTLVSVLESRGWNKISRITLLNDTVAALLAGRACARNGAEYSSYIGFILGTGMNAAYIQPAAEKNGESIEKQIVVCESGKCDKIGRSDFDLAVDKKTNGPGQFILEKCCSGAYLGKMGFELITTAAKEGLFSDETAKRVSALQDLTLIEMNMFLHAPFEAGTVADLCADERDRKIVWELFDAAVERCAGYATAILGANAVQTGEGKNPLHPVAILCNGTTYAKTYNLRLRVESALYEYLTKKRGIFYEIVTAENDITLGTAVAGSL